MRTLDTLIVNPLRIGCKRNDGGDPDFWRDLAEKLRALQTPTAFYASWKSENNSLFEWSVRSTKVVGRHFPYTPQFEALAARGEPR